MVNPERASEPDSPLFPLFDETDTQGQDAEPAARSGRHKATLITIGAVMAAAAVAVPVTLLLIRDNAPQLRTPVTVAGLTRDDASNATQTANYLQNAVAAGMGLEKPIGAVYTDGRGDSHSVIIIGGASSNGSQSERLARLFGLLDDATDGVTALTAEPAGSLGGMVKCGLATESGTSPGNSSASNPEMAVCGWADDQTVGIAMFPNRPVPEAASLFKQMRPAIEGHN